MRPLYPMVTILIQ